jgi:methylase of polypeptide subunit release factors
LKVAKSHGRLPRVHPTVKPVALVVDAINDCSKQGDIVLDPFCGSGTIIIAAERTGRKARALEIDPAYVDVAIRRWEQLTGKSAMLSTGGTFEEITEQRTVELDFAQVEAVASLAGENHVVSPLKPPAPKSLGAARNSNQANRAIRLAVPDANSI